MLCTTTPLSPQLVAPALTSKTVIDARPAHRRGYLPRRPCLVDAPHGNHLDRLLATGASSTLGSLRQKRATKSIIERSFDWIVGHGLALGTRSRLQILHSDAIRERLDLNA